jgi:hypothetical protein
VIFTRRSERDVVYSSEGDDELDTRPRLLVKIVAAILALAMFVLFTNLFFSLVLGR